MKSYMMLFISGMILFLFSQSCTYHNEEDLYPSPPPCDTSNVTFSGTITPILNANCVVCHSGANAPFNITLDNYNGVKSVAGNGQLWGAVNHELGFTPMPYQAGKQGDCDLLKIRNWLDQGAPDN